MFNKIILIFVLLVTAFAFNSPDDNFENKIATDQSANDYNFEMSDLLGLGDRPTRMKRHSSLRNSASKFLLEVYNEISDEGNTEGTRVRRSSASNLITDMDRMEIEKCNNIITFSSKRKVTSQRTSNPGFEGNDIMISFNTKYVPKNLQLVHSELRIYQNAKLGRYSDQRKNSVTMSVYQKLPNRKQQTIESKRVASVNSTTTHNGWLEFNVTQVLDDWLQKGYNQQRQDLTLAVNLTNPVNATLADIGMISAHGVEEYQPYIIAYFNGPTLMANVHHLRSRRDVTKRKADYHMPPPAGSTKLEMPKTCQRMNFTIDFRELQMHEWVIAPQKFEAYFCGGDCNFPLSSKMNASNHAIVQTLMHLQQPHLPKPGCAPTVLGSISILQHLNEDSVNLKIYPQSVAKSCGCH